MNGVLRVRENSSMSLACVFEAFIEDSIVKDITLKGYPRSNGDHWFFVAKDVRRGDVFERDDIQWYLSFNNRCNVTASFTVKDNH